MFPYYFLTQSRCSIKEKREKKLWLRKYFSPGPNYTWYINGYYKLKPFGVLLNVNMKGFS